MTALDQAFIKAYGHGAGSQASLNEADRVVPLAEALVNGPPGGASQGLREDRPRPAAMAGRPDVAAGAKARRSPRRRQAAEPAATAAKAPPAQPAQPAKARATQPPRAQSSRPSKPQNPQPADAEPQAPAAAPARQAVSPADARPSTVRDAAREPAPAKRAEARASAPSAPSAPPGPAEAGERKADAGELFPPGLLRRRPPRRARPPARPKPSLGETDLAEIIPIYRVDAAAGRDTEASAAESPADENAVPAPHIQAAVPEARTAPPHPAAVGAGASPPPAPPSDQGEAAVVCVEAEPAAEPVFAPRDEPFEAMLQVDYFTWPRACHRLMHSAGEEFERWTDWFIKAQRRGQKVLATGACRRGEGTTTLLLCAARRLAERGLKVVLVDADLAEPSLARRLGVKPQSGWEAVLTGRMPLAEVVVESVDDRLALLPTREAFGGAGIPLGHGEAIGQTIETLKAHYDLVLIDLGPLEDPAVLDGVLGRGIGPRLDALILVQNVRATSGRRLAEVQQSLAASGVVQAGVVQNLVAV